MGEGDALMTYRATVHGGIAADGERERAGAFLARRHAKRIEP